MLPGCSHLGRSHFRRRLLMVLTGGGLDSAYCSPCTSQHLYTRSFVCIWLERSGSVVESARHTPVRGLRIYEIGTDLQTYFGIGLDRTRSYVNTLPLAHSLSGS